VALPAFGRRMPHAAAAVRLLLLNAGRASIDRYFLPAGPTAANPQQTDRQTDGRTPYGYTDPAGHTMLTVPMSRM